MLHDTNRQWARFHRASCDNDQSYGTRSDGAGEGGTGTSAGCGWAGAGNHRAPILDALGQIATGLQRLAETGRNLAAQQALVDDRLLRIEHNRVFATFSRVVSAGKAMLERAKSILPPRLKEDAGDDPPGYAKWVAHELAGLPSAERARVESSTWIQRPRISVIMVVRMGKRFWKVWNPCADRYENWELCVAVNQAGKSRVSGLSVPVRCVAGDALDGAEALNAAANMATGEYLSFLPETGALSPLALYYVAEAARQGAFDVLYSDEDCLDAERRRVRPIFKPDWSPDLLTSCMYAGHLLTIRRECFLQAGGLSGNYGDAHLFDLVLRLADRPLRVRHIPRVLCHCLSSLPLPLATDAAARAIADAIVRREQAPAACVPGPSPGTFVAAETVQ